MQSILLEVFSVIRGKLCFEHGPQFPVKCQWVYKGLLKIVSVVFECRGDWGSKVSDFKLLSLTPLSLRWIETTEIALLCQHLRTEISLKWKDWIWLWRFQNYVLCTVYCFGEYFKSAFELNSVNIKSTDSSACVKCSGKKNQSSLYAPCFHQECSFDQTVSVIFGYFCNSLWPDSM